MPTQTRQHWRQFPHPVSEKISMEFHLALESHREQDPGCRVGGAGHRWTGAACGRSEFRDSYTACSPFIVQWNIDISNLKENEKTRIYRGFYWLFSASPSIYKGKNYIGIIVRFGGNRKISIYREIRYIEFRYRGSTVSSYIVDRVLMFKELDVYLLPRSSLKVITTSTVKDQSILL